MPLSLVLLLIMVRNLFVATLLAGLALAAPQRAGRSRNRNPKGYPFVDPLTDYKPPPNPYNIDGQFIDWRTYKSNGVNLGSWLEKEKTHDPIWWDRVGGANVSDEWASLQTSLQMENLLSTSLFANF